LKASKDKHSLEKLETQMNQIMKVSL